MTMNWRIPLLLCVAWTVLGPLVIAAGSSQAARGVASDVASFYGASYVAVPLQDAKSTTELRMRFRTSRADALLFLAAGRTDYCMVRLEAGRLKVHINLGAGESELSSAKGLRLDDLLWHEVVISRKDADISVQVDTIHVTREKLPGRFYELNIHYGLFVGGQGDFSELFLGHLESLRGCLADVTYNGVAVLARARERLGTVDVHGVTWSCAEEFDAGPERDVSFVEDGAFMALPNAISRTGARWQLELKTGSKRGILLYNTGLSSRSDFVGVELEGGRVRLLVDKGDGPAELRSDTPVSDGRWHRVAVHFNPTYMEISVDGQVASMRLALGDNRYLDLAETVYVGGIELNKRARALNQGLRSAEESFKGCVRNMEVDGKKIGIPEARITLGILPDCVWEFPCARDEPCVAGARCFQHGVDSFRCECEQPLCVKSEFAAGYKVFTKTSLPVDLEIVALNSLNVAEGDNAVITPHNIDVVLDYPKFGVRDSGVIFRVVAAPRHGRVQAEQAWSRGNEATVFTLLDLGKDKVRYVHDGSESHADAIDMELELNPGTGFTLPGYLQGRHRFLLPVNVSAVNDPPELVIPAGKVLRLAQGTKKTIGPDLLTAQDPDTSSSELVYAVLSVNAGGKDGRSHLESSRNPGQALDTFTQKDIDEGTVAFVHHGEAGSGRVALRVSDGIETGAAAMMRVVAFPLQLRLVNNTGLVMTHNASSLIIPRNLAFVTNADEPEYLEINYAITKAPQFGTLQRLRNTEASGEARWQTVQHFTSFQLAREQIRYVHTTGSPTHDEFKFQVSAVDTKSPTVYDFRIIFVELRLDSVHNEELTLDGVQDGTIRATHLHYDTVPQASAGEEIVYHIIRSTRYGSLILGDGTASSATETRLKSGDTCTQQDVASGRLRYALTRRAYSRIHDEFSFRVSTKAVNNGEPSQEVSTFSLIHIPGPTSDPVRATIERLEVVEGGQQTITQSHLHLETSRVAAVSYNITRSPRHGRIDVLKAGTTGVARSNTSWFDSREIESKKVVYIHDDSESRKDSFHFLAYAPDFQYLGVFHFDIVLKNDNKPVRTVDRVFRVVRGGERLITGADLRFEDADLDTRPEDIVYTRRGIPNYGIYRASDTEPLVPLFEFTQADLDAGRVLFKHGGTEEYGKVVLMVSDGDSYVSGDLEIRASPPFIEVVNNSGLIVQRSAAIALTPANLSAETNVNARSNQLKYEVTEAPTHGILELDGEPTKVFSEHDLEQGGVVYRHDGSNALKDHFRFRVEAGGARAEGRFEIRVFPAAYWEPLQVVSNRTLHVEESTSVQIGPALLKVIHPQIPPSDITFVVQTPPRFGYLELEPAPTVAGTLAGSDETVQSHGHVSAPQVTIFDQALVDAGRLHYVQAAANATRDHVVVDVTNGIWSAQGLWLRVVVVPKHVYVQGGELNVREGGSTALTRAHVAVITEYYAARVTEFRVLRAPKAGRLQLAPNPGESTSPSTKSLQRFTVRQLESGQVQYQHNGSEVLSDQFALVARVAAGGERESLPATVRVHVVPVDDEKPRLVNNSGLSLYEGAVLVLRPDHLGASDADSPPENITFVVTAPRGGFLSLRAAPRHPIERFTQAQLAARLVLFVHTGGSKNVGFHVSLTDGINAGATQHSVSVTVHDLNLRLVKNARLHVFPMLRQTLSPRQLLAVTSDPGPPPRHILYNVKVPPTLGRLITETSAGTPKEITSFTQRDVNESRVWYEHTKAFTDLKANDSFVFDVSTDFAESLVGQIFRIDVTVSSMTSGGLARFLHVEPITVDEGGSAELRINTSGVARFLEQHSGGSRPSLVVLLTGPPSHGELLVRGSGVAESGATFSQRQLEAGDVKYQHDHSDTESDEIIFSLILQGSDQEEEGLQLYNGTVTITVRPINDQPFSLRTNAPNMSVVQGQSRALTPEELNTEDADTSPQNIVYDVISGPSQGRLLLVHRQERNGTLVERVEQAGRFSQEDINTGKLVYEHTGTLQPASFYFRVGDGHFNPVYTVFNINILKLNLTISAQKDIPIQQGSSVAFIMSEHLDILTNGQREKVKYNVTREPRHGKVYLRDLPVKMFGQLDVNHRQVMYMQTDMTTSTDTFSVMAWLPGTDVTSREQHLNVTVEPLLLRGNFTAIAGTKNRLGLEVLDATPLAKLTNSNPTYEVIKKPRLGRIKKIIRITTSGEGNRETRERERDVNKFSHEEIKSGVIYYVARRGVEASGAEESVTLLLSGSIFQPAQFELRFPVRHERAAEHHAPGSGPTASVTPPRRGGSQGAPKGDTELASPNLISDYVLVFGVIICIIILAVIIVVGVKCRNSRSREVHGNANGKADQAYGPNTTELVDTAPTLPRPPDHLLPLSPRPPRAKRFINANGSTHFSDSGDSWRAVSPIPVSIPQCKVIPLDSSEGAPPSSNMGSEIDVNVRYPYGVSDDQPEDWSSYDTQSDLPYPPRTTNPMLRRNQYWV